jgi:anaphase-promoting complex subunit 2
VKEYQQLLSERLITNGWIRHLQSEFAYLDTMKKRFNEGELNHCDVMLKDVKESGKLANYAAPDLPFPFSPRVISSVYWPEIVPRENNLSLNSVFRNAIDAYEKVYSKHKPAQSVHWLTDYGGLVEMSLEIEGFTIEINAQILQAQILMLFMEKGRLFFNIFEK